MQWLINLATGIFGEAIGRAFEAVNTFINDRRAAQAIAEAGSRAAVEKGDKDAIARAKIAAQLRRDRPSDVALIDGLLRPSDRGQSRSKYGLRVGGAVVPK